VTEKERYYVKLAGDRPGYYVVDRKDGETYAWRGIEKDAIELAAKKNGVKR
jgi:hypothetical protein